MPSIRETRESLLSTFVPKSGTAGFPARDGSGATTSRTITAGTGIAVTNGSGAAGNPTISTSGVPALLATYTHTTNTERQPTAVDVSLDTITIAGHGYAANTVVYAIGNVAAQTDYPHKVLPGGLSMGVAYYVLVVDANTISLSATSGGAAIDLTAKGTADPSAWHLESGASSVTITGIGTLYRARLRIIGRQLKTDAQSYLYLPGHVADTAFRRVYSGTGGSRASGVAQRLHFDLDANVWGHQEIEIDTAGPVLNIRARATGARTSTDSANVQLDYVYLYSRAESALAFSQIEMNTWVPANGFTVEVWSY